MKGSEKRRRPVEKRHENILQQIQFKTQNLRKDAVLGVHEIHYQVTVS